MQITVEIADEIAHRLNQAWGSLSHRLLEMVVADAYRCGDISKVIDLYQRLNTSPLRRGNLLRS